MLSFVGVVYSLTSFEKSMPCDKVLAVAFVVFTAGSPDLPHAAPLVSKPFMEEAQPAGEAATHRSTSRRPQEGFPKAIWEIVGIFW